MKPLYIVLLVLSCLKLCTSSRLTTKEHNFGELEEQELKDNSRSLKNDMIYKFIKEKLINQSQALAHIVKLVESTKELLMKLGDLVQSIKGQSRLAETTTPDKTKVSTSTIRQVDEDTEPMIAFGQNMRRYGSLMKNLILKEIHDDPTAPVVLIEH